MTIKLLARTTSSRYIIPVYTVFDDNKVDRVGNETVRKEKFPNTGSVVVHRDSSILNENFKFNELFLIQIEETKNFEEHIPSSCKYQSLNGNISSSKKLPLVIESSILYAGDIVYLPYSDLEYIFLIDSEFLYGPYSVEQISDARHSQTEYEEDDLGEQFRYRIVNLDTYSLGIDDTYSRVILKFDRKKIENGYFILNQYRTQFSSELKSKFHILDIKHLIQNENPIDFILDETDEDILYWAEGAFPKGYTDSDLKNFNSSNNTNLPFDEKRFERFLSIKEKSTKWLEFLNSYISTKYLESDEGRSRLDNYIETNRSTLLKETEEQLKNESLNKLKEIEEENIEAEKKRDNLKEQVDNLTQQKERLSSEQELVKEKSEVLKKIIDEIKDKSDHLTLLNDIDYLRNEKEKLLDYNATTRSSIEQQEYRLHDLQRKNKDELNKTINELFPFVQAIVGAPIKPENATNSPAIKQSDINFKSSFEINEFISDAKEFLSDNGRVLEENEIINILTCLNQSFVTVFTGLPGVGKTSLSRLFSNFLCPQSFSIEIPVGRGWTNRKNLLGYYNPLKGEYQVDEYGIVNMLNFLKKDSEFSKKTFFIITLDEANLSPIEHYWSDFISFSDPNFRKPSIFLSSINENQKSIDLPSGLRFIFTINHDHTTELLSPRLIDRACFIKIEHSQAFTPSFINKPTEVPQEYYSHELVKKTAKFGKQVIASPRKLQSIYKYCSTSRDIYKERGGGQFTALDYAFLQFVLPLINGHGTSFEARLAKLKEELQSKSLVKSAHEVEDIINKGKDFQNYSFFN